MARVNADRPTADLCSWPVCDQLPRGQCGEVGCPEGRLRLTVVTVHRAVERVVDAEEALVSWEGRFPADVAQDSAGRGPAERRGQRSWEASPN